MNPKEQGILAQWLLALAQRAKNESDHLNNTAVTFEITADKIENQRLKRYWDREYYLRGNPLPESGDD